MDKILVLDFGGQYNQLIARRVRDRHVYAEIKRYSAVSLREIVSEGYKGIIFTGGPHSVYEETSPHFDPAILDAGIPVLGICYGAQLMAWMAGGEIRSARDRSEYGRTEVTVNDDPLFDGVPRKSICWMSHTDYISRVPDGFAVTAYTDGCPAAAMSDPGRRLYAVQFHPEVTHTEYGMQMLSSFIFGICGCCADWNMDDFVGSSVARLRRELDGHKVLLALSGGVDSSVAAVLLSRAIGDRLTCVFVDHGLLRKDEGDQVEQVLGRQLGVNMIRVNAADRFLGRLKGVTEPEEKRRIIGEEFIRVFESESERLKDLDILAQGTIYPDVIESGNGDSAVIKSHHNVGGLPDTMTFTGIVEPLRDLFKDEVREAGRKLGIPEELVSRQPFPGPGLAIRIAGEVTEDKLELLREADAIYREEVAAGCPGALPDQYFAVLTDVRSVGVMGDARTYGRMVVLRAVQTTDFMTADVSRLPYEVLEKASNRITNEVRGIGRVVYDITSKPPATIEFE